MRNRLVRFIELSICIVLGVTLLFGSAGCLLRRDTPPIEYEVREVGDFVAWFYEDYCEIYGTTEEGNIKRFLVIPEYLDGVRVEGLGFSSLAGGLDTRPGDLTWPRIESKVIEKIYFESAIDCYAWLGKEYISGNFKKIMYPEMNEYLNRFEYLDVYFPRLVYEKATEDEKISRYDRKHPANVSYYYNYENTKNNGYYWIDDCDYGGKIEFIPKDPTRIGYTFDGWYKEPECINKWDFEVDTLPDEQKQGREEVTVYQETILYAKWI